MNSVWNFFPINLYIISRNFLFFIGRNNFSLSNLFILVRIFISIDFLGISFINNIYKSFYLLFFYTPKFFNFCPVLLLYTPPGFIFEDVVFEDVIFEDVVFEDVIFEDVVFEDVVFEEFCCCLEDVVLGFLVFENEDLLNCF